jgi:hypothetical protein
MLLALQLLNLLEDAGAADDTTPDQFTFTDQVGVDLSATITSNAITITGIDAPVTCSVSGGTQSLNGAAFTALDVTVNNGDQIRVRHTSSGSNTTATNTTLTINGVSDIFTSTTKAAAGAGGSRMFGSIGFGFGLRLEDGDG